MSMIKCLECGTILESKFRHDFQMCRCPNQSFVDGGNAYCRVGGMDLSKIEVLEEIHTSDLISEQSLLEAEERLRKSGSKIKPL